MNTSARDNNLVAHIVFRFDYGGLENGVVNLINGLTSVPYRHRVIALTEVTEFAGRLRNGIEVDAINKKPGKDFGAYVRLYRLLRRLRPAVVHTRNMGTMDCAFIAFLARVPVRIHGEHGWDIFDPDGTNRKYRWMRRLLSHFVWRFVTVSDDLKCWLVDVVGIPERKVQHICNGVSTERFRPGDAGDSSPLPDGFIKPDTVVIGSVTRFSAIKDPMNLVEAFIAAQKMSGNVRLVMIGDGELLNVAKARLAEAGVEALCWLPGSCDDVPELLRSVDVFVLGSLREGISNTVLEAMASGLPVIATDTGGNRELVEDNVNGQLVPPGDYDALRNAILAYVLDARRRLDHGQASRQRVESHFSIDRMVDGYRALYDNALARGAG